MSYLRTADELALNFVHKRIIGAAGGFLSGGFAGAASGFLRGGSGSVAPGTPPLQQSTPFSRGQSLAVTPSPGPCPGATNVLVNGVCVDPFRVLPGGRPPVSPVASAGPGQAVMGRFGAGLEPDRESRQVFTCLPGMVLGKDDICYNRRDIRNSDRQWPKARKPLGTPGELNAVTTARRFARRVELNNKRLMKMGMLPKPKGRSRAASRTAVHHSILPTSH